MYSVTPIKVAKGQFRNYCYLIVDQKTRYAALVDPAFELDSIVSQLKSQNADLKAILLTHSHFDHVDLMEPLVQLFQPKVWISQIEASTNGLNLTGHQVIGDGTVIKIGETGVLPLLTPGHTAGGTCFQLDQDIFTGDTLFVEGCGICDLPGGSPVRMFESFQRLRNLIPARTRVWPGHCYGKEPGVTFEKVLESNIYFHFTKMDDFVKFRMRHSRTDPLEFR